MMAQSGEAFVVLMFLSHAGTRSCRVRSKARARASALGSCEADFRPSGRNLGTTRERAEYHQHFRDHVSSISITVDPQIINPRQNKAIHSSRFKARHPYLNLYRGTSPGGLPIIRSTPVGHINLQRLSRRRVHRNGTCRFRFKDTQLVLGTTAAGCWPECAFHEDARPSSHLRTCLPSQEKTIVFTIRAQASPPPPPFQGDTPLLTGYNS